MKIAIRENKYWKFKEKKSKVLFIYRQSSSSLLNKIKSATTIQLCSIRPKPKLKKIALKHVFVFVNTISSRQIKQKNNTINVRHSINYLKDVVNKDFKSGDQNLKFPSNFVILHGRNDLYGIRIVSLGWKDFMHDKIVLKIMKIIRWRVVTCNYTLLSGK